MANFVNALTVSALTIGVVGALVLPANGGCRGPRCGSPKEEREVVNFEYGKQYSFGALQYTFTRASMPGDPSEFCKEEFKAVLPTIETPFQLEDFDFLVFYMGSKAFSCGVQLKPNPTDEGLGGILNDILK